MAVIYSRDMAMDSPLRRWRRKYGVTQEQIAQRCGVSTNSIARWEQANRVPSGPHVRKLIEITGLSADALMFPERYLAEHPEFLARWAEQPPRRGRPRRDRPAEEPHEPPPGEERSQ
jgi:transcriptional regulator with XRE-family HTH domain